MYFSTPVHSIEIWYFHKLQRTVILVSSVNSPHCPGFCLRALLLLWYSTFCIYCLSRSSLCCLVFSVSETAEGNLGLCSLVHSSVISVCQSLRIIAGILAIHLGSFWRSFRCYSLKLGNFTAGPWVWCDRVLLEQWTRVRARPGAAMQVCALC